MGFTETDREKERLRDSIVQEVKRGRCDVFGASALYPDDSIVTDDLGSFCDVLTPISAER